jgi:antitoxin component of MazEF toxin-antitoxin module
VEVDRRSAVRTRIIRKSGNNYVISIPKAEMERLDLHEGDLISLDIHKVERKEQLDRDTRTAFEHSLEVHKEDYDYLADN